MHKIKPETRQEEARLVVMPQLKRANIAGGIKYNVPADNWQDRNIGSVYQPVMFSEACDC